MRVHVDQHEVTALLLGGNVGRKDATESGAVNEMDCAQIDQQKLVLRRQVLDFRSELASGLKRDAPVAEQRKCAAGRNAMVNLEGFVWSRSRTTNHKLISSSKFISTARLFTGMVLMYCNEKAAAFQLHVSHRAKCNRRPTVSSNLRGNPTKQRIVGVPASVPSAASVLHFWFLALTFKASIR